MADKSKVELIVGSLKATITTSIPQLDLTVGSLKVTITPTAFVIAGGGPQQTVALLGSDFPTQLADAVKNLTAAATPSTAPDPVTKLAAEMETMQVACGSLVSFLGTISPSITTKST